MAKSKKKSPKALFLFQKVVQTLVDACAEIAQLVDFVAITALNISASSDKSPEQTEVVPSQNKHEWEGYQIAQCPPDICEDCQKHEWHNKAYRHRNKDTYANME